jgi:type VI secretion system secreted protein Hcp
MAFDAALTITGEKQGQIEGGVTSPGHEGAIRVVAARHVLDAPRDTVTGHAIGRRQHGPMTITKEVDQATPRLIAAWVNNESLSLWRLDMFGVDASGRQVVAYTIELRSAIVSKVDLVMPTTLDPANRNLPAHEHVSFVYGTIAWTWNGSVAATDDWSDAP